MKKLLYILALIFCSVPALAQNKDWGRVSASLESLNHFYVDDAANNFLPTEDYKFEYLNGRRYATNNYLKVDYYKGRLSAGLQLEGYFPTTIGYPLPESMLSLSNLYVAWTDNDYSVTAGTFYEQLGSGLLFRSWEDRALGLNNAILGARATYNYKDIFNVRVFGGIPRVGKITLGAYNNSGGYFKVFSLGLTQTALAAADVGFSLSECLGWNRTILAVEGSVLYKHEELNEFRIQEGLRTNNFGYSARINFDIDGFYAKGEYVGAGKQYSLDYGVQDGNAQLIELGYNNRGLGISFTGRRLYCMQQRVMLGTSTLPSEINIMSYAPALCSQHTYMLANLNPYTPYVDGEIGGQIDAFYNFRRGTKIGGKRGLKVHANLASYFSLGNNGAIKGSKESLLDFCFDVEKQWTKKFKMTLLYSLQDHNREQMGLVVLDGENMVRDIYIGMSHTVVADLLYKWTKSFSTRLELQYLTTKDYQKDWMAALLEVSFAPSWSIFASDMYNHGSTKMHYYNAGVSYSYKWIRVAAGYGRYRAGFICSGGVCRQIPAYTGANLTLTASF